MEERIASCHGHGHFIKIKLEGKRGMMVNDEGMRGEEERKKARYR